MHFDSLCVKSCWCSFSWVLFVSFSFLFFFSLSLSNRILTSHLLFHHSRLYPQVVAGKRYFMFLCWGIWRTLWVGLHISTVSDAGQGTDVLRLGWPDVPTASPYCWVAAGRSPATCFLMAPLACGLSVVGLLQSRCPRYWWKLMPFPASSQRSHSVVASAVTGLPTSRGRTEPTSQTRPSN